MDRHFRRGDNAESYPVAVYRHNRNGNTVANDQHFSKLATENQHVSPLRGNKILRTDVSTSCILRLAKPFSPRTLLGFPSGLS
jgi:hypothetical protein